MIDQIISNIADILRATFLTGDVIGLAIAFGAVMIAALATRRAMDVGGATFFALALFALGGFLRGVFAGASEASIGARMGAQAERSLNKFMALPTGDFLAYFLAFLVLVFLFFVLKSIFSRG